MQSKLQAQEDEAQLQNSTISASNINAVSENYIYNKFVLEGDGKRVKEPEAADSRHAQKQGRLGGTT